MLIIQKNGIPSRLLMNAHHDQQKPIIFFRGFSTCFPLSTLHSNKVVTSFALNKRQNSLIFATQVGELSQEMQERIRRRAPLLSKGFCSQKSRPNVTLSRCMEICHHFFRFCSVHVLSHPVLVFHQPFFEKNMLMRKSKWVHLPQIFG